MGGHVETGSWTFLVQVHEAASIWCRHARMFLCLLSISKAKMLEDLKLCKCNDQLSLGWSWCSRQNIKGCKLIQSLCAVPFSGHPSPWSRHGHLLGRGAASGTSSERPRHSPPPPSGSSPLAAIANTHLLGFPSSCLALPGICHVLISSCLSSSQLEYKLPEGRCLVQVDAEPSPVQSQAFLVEGTGPC